MHHNLKGTAVDLTPELRGYIDTKLGSLEKLLRHGDAARMDVELEYLASEEKSYRAELMLHDGEVVRAEARGQALHEAFDKALNEMRLELTRLRKRRLRLLRHGAAKFKDIMRGWRRE